MNRKAVLPLLALSLTAIVVTSAAVNVAAPTNRCILPKGLFPKLPPGFKDPREQLLCNQKKRSTPPQAVTKKAPRLSSAPIWIRQLGTEELESSYDVAVGPQGNIYITGNTLDQNYVAYEAFVAKYNPQGKLLWKKQLGTSSDEESSEGIAIDSRGNAFITGWTTGQSKLWQI
jgi:hypothetical protein